MVKTAHGQTCADLRGGGCTGPVSVARWELRLTDVDRRGRSLVRENERISSSERALARLQQVASQIETLCVAGTGRDLFNTHRVLVTEKVLEFLEPPEA